jgi:hypothetical protein
MTWLLIVKERSWRSTNPSWKAEPIDKAYRLALMKIVSLERRENGETERKPTG